MAQLIHPTGQWVLLAVVCVVSATSVVACLVPAWRAVRIDPLVALRDA